MPELKGDPLLGRIEFFPPSNKTARLDDGTGVVPVRVSELIERRSPYAQSEFVYNVIPGTTTFYVPHSLRPGAEDRVYAQLIEAQGDVRIWRDPSDAQRPGLLTLRCSTAMIPVTLLLFIPRP